MGNLPHYHFSFRRSQLRTDMINAIKEAMKMRDKKYLDLSSENATLIRNLNGIGLEEVSVIGICVEDDEVYYKGIVEKNGITETVDEDWLDLDDDFQAYITCDCSIYEAVYNRLNSL